MYRKITRINMDVVSKRCLFTSVLAQMPMFLCFDTNIGVGVG